MGISFDIVGGRPDPKRTDNLLRLEIRDIAESIKFHNDVLYNCFFLEPGDDIFGMESRIFIVFDGGNDWLHIANQTGILEYGGVFYAGSPVNKNYNPSMKSANALLRLSKESFMRLGSKVGGQCYKPITSNAALIIDSRGMEYSDDQTNWCYRWGNAGAPLSCESLSMVSLV